jgi:hypothetical protein
MFGDVGLRPKTGAPPATSAIAPPGLGFGLRESQPCVIEEGELCGGALR